MFGACSNGFVWLCSRCFKLSSNVHYYIGSRWLSLIFCGRYSVSDSGIQSPATGFQKVKGRLLSRGRGLKLKCPRKSLLPSSIFLKKFAAAVLGLLRLVMTLITKKTTCSCKKYSDQIKKCIIRMFSSLLSRRVSVELSSLKWVWTFWNQLFSDLNVSCHQRRQR